MCTALTKQSMTYTMVYNGIHRDMTVYDEEKTIYQLFGTD